MTLKHGNKPVHTIFVHQATTRPEWMEGHPVEAKRDEIRKWHKTRGWSDIGYHYVIDRDGKIATGRPESRIGAHVKGHNTGSIGICLLGGHGATKSDPFSQHFTEDQDAALRGLIDDIKTRANIKRVRGHSEVANKACPGFSVAKWLKPVPSKQEVVSAMEKSTKHKAASCAKWASAGLAGVSAGWSDVKSQIGIGQEMVAAFEKLITSNQLLVVSGLCIVSAITFNWMQIKQKEDFKEGRYTPSGDAT